MVCRYGEEIGLPPHACGTCVYDPDEIKARRNQRIIELEAERDALKAALEVAFDYAMQNISDERQRFAGYKPERHAQWAKDEALMRAALAAKGE